MCQPIFQKIGLIIRWDAHSQNDIQNLFNDMTNSQTKNLYLYAHGNGAGVASDGPDDLTIDSWVVASLLENYRTNTDEASNCELKVTMKVKHLYSMIGLVSFFLSCHFSILAQLPPRNQPIDLDDPKGVQLGPGVPRTVDTYGNVIYIDLDFTTRQYEQAALKLIIQEANRVAEEMQLPENLPITESNIAAEYIGTFGFNYRTRKLGGIATTNYAYFVSSDYKFNNLCIADYDQTCLNLAKQKLPIDKIDTNAAYQLATQWLASASMDVGGLNRDCTAHSALSLWNPIGHLGQKPKISFVPIYFVWWTSPQNDAERFGSVAYVELYLPTKKLLQLDVDGPQYILRKPLLFTNLASLFPGTARVFTNRLSSIPQN